MRVAVIGAGQAGVALAAKLRALGHQGPITLLGSEATPPYQRPPLSKGYLLGEVGLDRLTLRGLDWYAQNDIDLRLGAEVTGIDRAARTIEVGGTTLAYDQLALTTGATPRHLPPAMGGALAGVHYIRSLADVDAMAPAFRPGARVVIIGGGYIGLEAAAVAAKRGLAVTLVEAAPRILARVAAPETADWFRALHTAHGVTLMEGAALATLTGTTRVTGARLADGREVAADFAIVGIGILPETRLAAAAGLAIDNGIATDAEGRTSDPAIWAAGDCASWVEDGTRTRLESVPNAIDMAEAVAANMLGHGQPYRARPWFWSDQYDVKLQIAGIGAGATEVVVRDAPPARSHWYFNGPRLIAVDAMNDPRAFMIAKRLLEAGRSPTAAAVADPTTDLKALLA